jgi:PAS domain S-box-containing protein
MSRSNRPDSAGSGLPDAELGALVRLAPHMLSVMEPDGSISWVNDVAREYFGFDPSEVGDDVRAQVIHPEDLRALEARRREALRSGIPFDAEQRMRGEVGQYRWFTVRYRPLKDGNRVVRWFGWATDIEDLRRAEEAAWRSATYLAEAQRLSQTGSWAWDVRLDRMVYWSDELYRIYDFDPADGVPSVERALERVHPEDRERVRRASIAGTAEVEYRLLMPDGSVKHLRSLRQSIIDAAGNVTEVIGTAMDVTDRKRAEEERERMHLLQAELARINRVTTMGVLTASLAHEVRQPIAAAKANAHAVIRWLDRTEPGEAREAAARMVQDIDRAGEIFRRVSSLFRKGQPQHAPVDVNEVARETLGLLDPEARRHSVLIRAHLASGLSMVEADRVQLQQVFMNLVLNAIEAMQHTGGEVTVRSERQGDARLVVSVSDSGPGLAPESGDAMFEAFFTTKPQGTGMGLSICRTIIESHGGRLWADSTPGSGATFRFSLPVHAARPAPQAQAGV